MLYKCYIYYIAFNIDYKCTNKKQTNNTRMKYKTKKKYNNNENTKTE